MNIQPPTQSDIKALRRLVQSTTVDKVQSTSVDKTTSVPTAAAVQKAAPQLPASPAGDMAALRRLVAGNAAPAPEQKKQLEEKTQIIVAGISDTAALRRLIAGQAPAKQMSSAKEKSSAKEAPRKQEVEATAPAPELTAAEMAPVSDIAALRRLIHNQAPGQAPAKEKSRAAEAPKKQEAAPTPEAPPEIVLEAAPAPVAEASPEAQPETPEPPPSDVAALRQLIHPNTSKKSAQKQKKSATAKKDSGKVPEKQAMKQETKQEARQEKSKQETNPVAKAPVEAPAQPLAATPVYDPTPAAAPEAVAVYNSETAPVHSPEPAQVYNSEAASISETAPLSDLEALRRLIPPHHDEPEAVATVESGEMSLSAPVPPEVSQQVASMAHPAAGVSAMTDLRRLLPADLSASEEAFSGAETLRGDMTGEILYNAGSNTGSLALEAGMGREMFFGAMPQFNMETMNRFLRSLVVCVPAVLLSLALMENPFTLPQPPLLAMVILSLAALNIAVLAALDSYRHHLGDLTIPALLGCIAMVMLYVFATVCDRVAGTRGYDWLTPVTMIALIVCYGGIFRERVIPLKVFLGFNSLSLTVLWCLGAADKMSLPF